jgi:RHS repeat-associated protein
MTTDKDSMKASSKFLKTDGGKTKSNAVEIPSISLPKGGGALKGIDEKFSVNAVNGTSSFSIPLPFSPARGASPSLTLSYSSGAGNGIFGLGWQLGLSSIKRKTDKELPQYLDAIDSDTFLFSEAEDLVPEFKKKDDGSFSLNHDGDYTINEKDSPDGLFIIRFYKPRTEGSFARIERWCNKANYEIKWRIITKENTTTLFGWTDKARIADPKDNSRIFEWLPEFTFDDKGNCSHFIYKKEDDKGFDITLLHNKNRYVNHQITYTNRYLSKVLYGNKTPYKKFGDAFPEETDYLFLTAFDYGEYSQNEPYNSTTDWSFRADAFSDYRAGFEIRTTRLCKRVLLFHNFTGIDEYSGLVRSLEIEYDTTQLNFTFLKSITTTGYIKQINGTYTHKSLPAMEFEYQKHEWSKEVKSIAADDLIHAPSGLDEQQYQFTDLFNEGLSGILTEQASGWYYKHNLGNGKFEQARLITPKPSFAGLGSHLQLADLDADGGKQLISFDTEPKGYFEMDDENTWQPLHTFSNLPAIDFSDANTRMIDLNGDGKPEIVISEDYVFTWYPSEGRNGFSQAQRTPKPFDEEGGPHIVFADEKQTIFLADMSGDGTTDIIRIRNGEICYWPNLGYGKFGAKVAMDNAPVFDHPDSFNPAYIRLADIDGSGTTDVIYLGKNTFTCWLNLSGNSIKTKAFEIDLFPEIHNWSKITVADLLGNGVACIVWSSNLPMDTNAPVKYVDLMNSRKPHIMISYKNNLGKEVYLEYTPSTKFYIDDKLAGKPWITKLHFPIHCVSKTETRDKISGYRFVSSYQYHHGYYDHAEREFRGFGMVEQTDSEHFEHWIKGDASNIVDKELHQEPVVSKSWHHTGAFMGREIILNQFAHEYWYEEMAKQGFPITHHETALPDAKVIAAPKLSQALIDQMNAQEWREALRACKGMTLRSETFAKDASKYGNTPEARKKELTPYSVSAHNCLIELVQPKGNNKFAVFTVKESEAITYSYERNTDDPRIAHSLNIKLDEYGNVLESAKVVYPRIATDTSLPSETQQQQAKTIIIYTQNKFTNDIIGDDFNRLRLPSETKTFELKGIDKAAALFTPSDFETVLEAALEIPYHQVDANPANGHTQKRLIEHARTNYSRNDLKGALPLNQLESMAFPFENYQLAYTPELLYDIYGSKIDSSIMSEGRFTHSENDNNWWIRSGITQFISNAETDSDARNRFYAPVSYTDPYGAVTKVKYYGSYFLFIEETEDALGNKSKVDKFNFRTLSPQRMRDINKNLSEAITDELGLVKATAIYGKGNEADDLTGLSEFTDATETILVSNFFNASDSIQLTGIGKDLLQHATMRLVYDFDIYKNTGKPAVVASIVREEHFRKNNNSPVQLSFEYSNGLGNVVLKKVQAEPGMAKKVIVNDSAYSVTYEDTSALNPVQLRWIGNGKTILNNKGNAVKQYEPYFSVTHQYENLKELVETGVTPIMYYDAAGRLVKTEMPDGTFSKVVFDSWKQVVYDANDTVPDSSWYYNRTNRLIDVQLLAEGKDPAREKEAADKAAKHANTPNVLHFDTLGRPVLSIDHNINITTQTYEYIHTKVSPDVEGNLRKVTDARGNTAMQYKYDMLGHLVYQNSMDAGQRWLLINIAGNPLRTWDERNHEFQYFYDILHRPTYSKAIAGDGASPLDHIFGKIIYGESLLAANRSNEASLQTKNILGKTIQHYDTGGLTDTPEYDFKGQPLSTTRQLFKKYKEVVNWTDANLINDLESDAFTFTTEKDALGRITQQKAPDGSVITPSYNEAGLLNTETVKHAKPDITTVYIKNIDYNEKGQRNKITYGNNVTTRFYYDKETFYLKRLETKRQNNEPLQDWYYTFDAVGNITHIEDKNIPVTFFNNQKITGVSEYTYDALYRLISATGRENDAALMFNNKDNWNDAPFMHQLNPSDPIAARNYTQNYYYDPVGNILQMKHTASGNNWTRNYTYETTNNRLKTTQVGSETYRYTHHPLHGYITVLPHLEEICWNFKEELVKSIRQRRTDGGTPETTWYQYDGQGQRIRKITENEANAGNTPTLKEERMYISGYELYKSYSGSSTGLERTSLSLMDEGNRFVMIDTETEPKQFLGIPTGRTSPIQTIRYQLHNHLGSAALELDNDAQVISYEEFHPYGTTAYQAKNAAIKAAAKRYRYTGMERDEETGLDYHSARYYLPWLGRWISSDPIRIEGGLNIFNYCSSNPIKNNDTNGKWPKLSDAKDFGNILLGYGIGVGESGVNAVKGVVHVATHLPETAAGVVHAVTNLPETVQAVIQSANQGADKWVEAIDKGDMRGAGRITGNVIGSIALAFVPAASAGKLSALSALSATAKMGAASTSTATTSLRTLTAIKKLAPKKTFITPPANYLKARAIVSKAAKLTNVDARSLVDKIKYKPKSGSFMLVTDSGERILTLGSKAFTRLPMGRVMEAAHEFAHAEQWAKLLSVHGGNLANALAEWQTTFGSLPYALREIQAEATQLSRMAKATKLPPLEVTRSLKYIKDWAGTLPRNHPLPPALPKPPLP